jgi:Lrp/AsnC family transcriptional regulator for asnA, asnC and gidA
VLKRLEGCPEVSEAYYTTGNYSFIMKVHTASIQHLHHFLTEQVQKISIVRSTETMVVMDTPIQRQLSVAEFKDRI